MSGFGGSPFGAAPFGAEIESGAAILADLASAAGGADTGTDATVIPQLAAGAAATDACLDRLYGTIADALVANSVFVPELLPVIWSSAGARDSLALSATLAGNVESALSAHDQVTAAWMLLLAESAAAVDTAPAGIRKILSLVDTLAAVGVCASQQSALATVLAAIAAEDAVRSGFSPETGSTAQLVDSATSIATMLAPLIAAAAGTDTAEPRIRITVISASGSSAADSLAAALSGSAELSDTAAVYAVLRLGGTDYRGWVMNTRLRAVSEHTNAAWNSFAVYRGRHYAAGEAGIAVFTGTAAADTAGGTPIEAFVRTAMVDFGTSRFKRVPDVFVGVDTDGRLYLKVRTRDREASAYHEDWYEVVRTKDGPGTARAELGRGLRSTWWEFELRNIDGAGFELDRLEMRPLVLDKRT